MQIILSNTTHSLEIETSIAGSIHYACNYVDITNIDDSLPLDSTGIITTATTSTIVSAPLASTTRKIQLVNIFNNGTTNTIKIKKDIVATGEIILLSAVLQLGECLRIVNDKVSILDASGREKTQNSLTNIEIGDSTAIYKIGSAPEASGQYYCFSKDSGFPGAWSPGTPGINGRNTDGSTIADTGCINIGNPNIGTWYLRDMNIASSVAGQYNISDFLWINTGLVVTTLTAQTITQPTLPARDTEGTSNGKGINAGILVTTATTNAANIANITLQYTNSSGVTGRTATMSNFPTTAVAGTFVKFQLQASDIGIRSIQSITLGTSLVTGAISLVCFSQLLSTSTLVPNAGNNANYTNLDIKLYNGFCLLPIMLSTGTTATTINGNVYFINK